MKKLFFATLLVIITVAVSCKKNTNTDPATPGTDTVASDSANFSLYIFASAEQMRYSDYCAYVTLNGAQEQKLELTSTVPYDSVINYKLANSCAFSGIPLDSIKIYRFDFRTKKGEQSLRFYGEKKNISNMPDSINIIVAYQTYKCEGYHYVRYYGSTDELDQLYSEINKDVNKFSISY